jgi:hypothetical protein
MATAPIKPKCGHPYCQSDGMECHLNDDADTVEWFCPEHCFEHGFCFGCGNFWAGTEGFDFSESHLCDDCESEVADEDVEIPEYPGLGEPWE